MYDDVRFSAQTIYAITLQSDRERSSKTSSRVAEKRPMPRDTPRDDEGPPVKRSAHHQQRSPGKGSYGNRLDSLIGSSFILWNSQNI